MSINPLPWNASLGSASRLPLRPRDPSSAITSVETAILLACGVGAAFAVSTLEFKLQIPGHSILRAVFPMTFGLAMVPRRGAGTVMGVAAVATVLWFSFAGWGARGLGAMTSLFLIGPCLDLAVRSKESGRRVYLSFVAAGVSANLAAFLVQIIAKSAGWKVSGMGKSLEMWLPRAAVSFPICGALAGLISAIVWFRWNTTKQQRPEEILK